MLFSFLFFFSKLRGFGDTADEPDEAVAVALGWDGGDLLLVVGEGFPEVFEAFYRAVLFISLMLAT